MAPVIDGGSYAVVTNRYDNFRNGANTSETTLNVANVGGGKFGLLTSHALDGQIYAQPLYLPGLAVNGGTHNVVFAATENDTVYAFDADSTTASAPPLWTASMGTAMPAIPSVVPGMVVPGASTVGCRDMYPKSGITSTPVIDRATGRMYVVAKTLESGVYHQRLHALDVLTGKEVAGSPVEIQGSVPGTGDGSVGGMVAFSAYHHLNRPGLLLTGGNVFIAFASHCDDNPYHGWVFAYSADTLTQKGIFNTTPNGNRGGIWQSGMGLVGDTNDVYFVSGNGSVDPTNKGAALAMSVGHLTLGPAGFSLTDWWTVSDAVAQNVKDNDFTSAPVMLAAQKVLVAGGKNGNLYVLDPANLGKYIPTGIDAIVQNVSLNSLGTTHHIHGGPVYWNGPSGPTLFMWSEGENLRSFGLTGNQINAMTRSEYTGDVPTHPGGLVSLSSNGSAAGSAIVWATFTSSTIDTLRSSGDSWHYLVPGAFYAFDATNLATPLWKSTTNLARDDMGLLAKFNAPVVANGKVYLGSQGPRSQGVAANMAPPAVGSDQGQLLVYGLLP